MQKWKEIEDIINDQQMNDLNEQMAKSEGLLAEAKSLSSAF